MSDLKGLDAVCVAIKVSFGQFFGPQVLMIPRSKLVNIVRSKNLPITCLQPLMDSGGDVTDQPYEAAIAAFGALIAGFCVRGCSIFYSYEFT